MTWNSCSSLSSATTTRGFMLDSAAPYGRVRTVSRMSGSDANGSRGGGGNGAPAARPLCVAVCLSFCQREGGDLPAYFAQRAQGLDSILGNAQRISAFGDPVTLSRDRHIEALERF